MPLNAPRSIAIEPGVFRPLARLAWPVFVEEILNMLVGYTDWWLAGRYLPGAEYGAAMGLIAYSLWLIPSFFSAVAIGAVAVVSRLVGAGEWQAARHITAQAVLLGACIALGGTTVVYLFAPTFAAAMNMEPAAAALAVRYLNIIVPVIPLIMFEQVGISCLRAAGDTFSGLCIKVLVNVINMSLSAGLVLGWGPLPQLGWEGLAIGTAAGHGLAGLIVALLLIRGRAGLKLHLRELRPDWPQMKRLLKVGLPGGVDVLALITCHLVFASIINRLGSLAAAAHGLGVQIEALAYLPGSAFQVAAATMTGQFLGAQEPQRAKRSALAALAVGGTFMCLAGLIFFFRGPQFAALFTGDPENPVSLLAGELLPIVSVGMPCFAILSILSGALRGAGDTRFLLALTFIGLICIRIPLAAVLAWSAIPLPFAPGSLTAFDLGVRGAWYAMIADVTVRAAIVLWRFQHGPWAQLKV